jgi:hypothetical protein
MGLVTACEGCGQGVTGAVTKLKRVNGKYLCPRCASNPAGVARFYCTNCKAYSPYARTKGSGWIELVLYLCYLIPGVIYSIWRRSGNSKLCPTCKQATLISAESGTHVKCPDCAELVLREARKCKHCGCGLVPQ